MQATLIWFDRLPYGLLGCCGNAEVPTPGFNELSASGVVFDNCFAANVSDDGSSAIANVIATAAEQGVDVRVIAHNETALTARIRECSPSLTVESTDETGFSLLVTESLGASTRRQSRSLTVISHPGFPSVIDGLQSERAQASLAAADVLVSQVFRDIPSPQVDGFTVVVSASLGVLPADDSVVPPVSRLREMHVHVPFFICSRRSSIHGARSRSVITTHEIAASLAGLLEQSPPDATGASLLADVNGAVKEDSPAVCIIGPESWYGLRTPAWYLLAPTREGDHEFSVDEAAEMAELFVKPDDLWDQLDVASQHPHVVEDLLDRLVNRWGQAGAS